MNLSRDRPLPSVHHLPRIYSPSPSLSSLSVSDSYQSHSPSQSPPSFAPSPPHHHHPGSDSPRTEEYKTSLEQAKLDRRRQEYALLRDALRRGIPYSAIPGLLASRDSSVRKGTGHGDYSLGGHHQHHPQGHIPGSWPGSGSDSPGLSVYGHAPGTGHGQAGVIYYIPTPPGPNPNPMPQPGQRRLDLDDSFLHRAYKRRRPWTGSARARSAQGGDRKQRITFHHYVPGVSK
ncbi:hypothetical protein P170DRAFT_507043 [Aspergillus steynii IBT 23096]|uniref:Uncharacterized protein n=1 Tax=Aspergillus steynii IBT 23096 TaxID=1392250 RepID=A0A2I2GH28_9EURO|nr:uncharacterized protein P170DRAFT_507043 [Aspergillus steynii IBT 23096]PLB52185.1 hypothetical protein P170DRAFT_507043 [Aspergillus steynii IBT 23096]